MYGWRTYTPSSEGKLMAYYFWNDGLHFPQERTLFMPSLVAISLCDETILSELDGDNDLNHMWKELSLDRSLLRILSCSFGTHLKCTVMKRRRFLTVGTLVSAAPCSSSLFSQKNHVEGKTIHQAARDVRIVDAYDVIVCGAGPAGVSAAIEAGRNGARTLLVEVNGCLGGVWTAGLLTWILDQANKPGLMREIEAKLVEVNAVTRDIDTGDILSFDPESMKLLLEQLSLNAGVEILLHTRVVDVAKNSSGRLTHIVTESKSGREAWEAKLFIDTTGDGDLASLSGCGYDLGRKKDQALQPFSMLALVTGIDFGEIPSFSRHAGDLRSGSKKRLLQEIIRGGYFPSYLHPGLYPIRKDLYMLMANHSYGNSPLNARAVTAATLEARREIHDIVNALKTNGGIWSNIRLVATPEQIGTREGRRIHGLYQITKEDLINGARFEDAVCRVTFPVDVHSVTKEGEENDTGYSQGVRSKNYDIPLRSLIARDVGGLMMAGRCISGDFIAHSSYRVTGNAVAMGQAAGRAVALAAKRGVLPQEIAYKDLGLVH